MSHQTFSLQPFPAIHLPDLEITGNLDRHDHQLAICYKLFGNLSNVAIAAPSDIPTRKPELWEDTCFEFFLGMKNADRYWEFNLSPGGHWNVYRFDGYRQGMQEERAFKTLPFEVQIQSNVLILSLGLDLDAIVPTNQALDLAITTVIKSTDGEITYWALTHRGSEADFHRRDSFLVEV